MRKYLLMVLVLAIISFTSYGVVDKNNVNLNGKTTGITKSSITHLATSTSIVNQGPASSSSSSNSGDSASWNEKPLSQGQLQSLESLSKSGSLKVNLNQSISQNIGFNVGQTLNPNAAQGEGQSSGLGEVQKFSEYYQMSPQSPSQPLSAPVQFQLKGQEPTTLYFGSTQKAIQYSQYQALISYTGMNSLWIKGPSSWTQYAQVPQGASLNLIAMASSSGNGVLYEAYPYPDETLSQDSYYFFPTNQIYFYADTVGEHLLFFVINGQPSNIVVVDVVSYQTPSTPLFNYAVATVSSSWLQGYDVYVDGTYQATEGMTGEPAGTLTVPVTGNQYHNIAVSAPNFQFSDYRFFQAGYGYTLNV